MKTSEKEEEYSSKLEFEKRRKLKCKSTKSWTRLKRTD
jgi:hypothetical protein